MSTPIHSRRVLLFVMLAGALALSFAPFAARADVAQKAVNGTALPPAGPSAGVGLSTPLNAPAPAPIASPSPESPALRPGEAEFPVPPGGAAVTIRIHPRAVAILSFPEPMSPDAKASSRDFEVKPWGETSMAVRANEKAHTSTLAMASKSGLMKINLTLRVVPENEEGMTMVRFKLVTEAEAFERRVATEVATKVRERMAPMLAEVAEAKRQQDEARQRQDALVIEKAEALIIERALKRNESLTLRAHERNEDAVIAHVRRASLLGDDGYLFFALENRGDMPFRVATAKVSTAEGKTVPSAVRLVAAISKDPRWLGVVPPGATVRGVVVLHGADPLLSKPLRLEIAGPEGRGAIRLTKGIALR